MSVFERLVMKVDEAIRQRRSVRGFLLGKAPEAIIREAFALAQLAPSNCNVQPWTRHLVSGEALRRLRAALVDAGLGDQPINPDFDADRMFLSVYRERQDRRRHDGTTEGNAHSRNGRHRPGALCRRAARRYGR